MHDSSFPISRTLAVATFLALAACGQVPATNPEIPLALEQAPPIAHPDPLAALEGTDPQLAANKRLAFDMWRGIVNAGQIEMADRLLAEHYIQHSPVLRTGRKAFKEIFSVVPRRDIPALVTPPLVQIVAEGDKVVMSLLESVPERSGVPAHVTTHFNLFRVADQRLAEHWHSVQAAPGPDVPLPEQGGPQPVTGASGEAQLDLLKAADPALAANKRLVFDMWREVVDARRPEGPARYFGTRFTDHSAGTGAGHKGFGERTAMLAPAAVQPTIVAPVVALVAEGDLVVLVTRREHPHPSREGLVYTTTWFDMFRIADGRVVAHWDAG